MDALVWRTVEPSQQRTLRRYILPALKDLPGKESPMHSNPYAIAQVDPSPASEAGQPSGLPMRLLITAMLCCAAGQVISWVIMWLTLQPEYLQAYLDDLWQLATYWLGALAIDGCSALLLTRYYLQRHSLVNVTRPGRLIALFAGFYFVAFVLVSLFFRLLVAQLIAWIYEGDHGISPTLLLQPLNLVSFVLATLLPLWLSLHLMRRTGQVESGLGLVSRGETALAFGLLFCVIYMKLLTLLPIGVINPYGMEWLQAVSSASGLLYGLIAQRRRMGKGKNVMTGPTSACASNNHPRRQPNLRSHPGKRRQRDTSGGGAG